MIRGYLTRFLETIKVYVNLTESEIGRRYSAINGMDLPTILFEQERGLERNLQDD